MRHHLKIVSLTISALTLSAQVLAQSAPAKEAAPLAREGTFEHKLCYSGATTPLAASETDRFGTYTVTGVAQSDNKAFDAMSMECVAAYEIRSGAWQHRGYCVFQDPSGDKYHGSDSWTTDGGYKVVYLGGTGKFKGMTGEASVKPLGNSVKPIRAGTLQGCRLITSTYKLP